jgi:hypothetical protein
MRSIILSVLFLGVIQSCSASEKDSGYQQIYQGEISAYDFDEYSLQLRKNDQLKVNLQPEILDVIIFSPINQLLDNQQTVIIDSSQTYQIRVLMPRALARKKEVHPYELSITVERN